MMLRIAVVGASGYAGGEVLRVLLSHPQVEITSLTAATSAGSKLADHHPHLGPLAARSLESSEPAQLLDNDAIVMALPHGASGSLTAELDALGYQGVVLDCGADHRLTDAEAWQQWYGGPYPGAWTYGLPELLHAGETCPRQQRELLRASRRIAVPGCNVTAVTLATQAAVAADLIDATRLTAVLAVGYSGAGKTLRPHLLASQALGNIVPYAVGGSHRHIPEIEQNLQVVGAAAPRVSFTPVLVPVSRGILATITAPLSPGVDAAALHAATTQCYQDEALVEVLPLGQWPTTGPVVGTGRAQLAVGVDQRAGVALMQAALDNLGKGTAGAAVQCLNLAAGLPETTAVAQIGVAP
ncbi:N-acetyl-gamma-glutamyl-phosphate reductase [Buchananella hordeovulneris]|uniref:N-acetyl-gamma-glutamyl-phosphate reductase n=1 Tax=Buchananella hordeovulneris TaxID=52770 RepID=UPI000F5F1070|nr:N-acetyl-gamma-glutamyl-phosphate reductase [Buchananella hordeovulneris]RRD49727.1 N-acetyl-gamma-glutamyl-phosphate reductase [Buchananella hordeovulneris]